MADIITELEFKKLRQNLAERRAIETRMDQIMDEIDSLSHVSEHEQYEALVGEFKNLEREINELEKITNYND